MNEVSDYDAVIVGAGPAGLAAARRLASAGLTTVVVDEQSPSPAAAAARAAGAECRTGTCVWGVADDGRTLLTAASDGSGPVGALRGRHLLLATGGTERVVPFPGWELPGVTTLGLARRLAGDGVPPGGRVVVAGSGPLLLPVASALLALGVRVAGIAQAGHPYRWSGAGLGMAAHPGRLYRIAAHAAVIARHRVPVWQDRVVLRADAAAGGDRVGAVVLADRTAPSVPVASVPADALCVGYGSRPQLELPRLLGCATRTDPRTGDLAAATDPYGRTSLPDTYVIGAAAGAADTASARAQGDLAACVVLAREGRPVRGAALARYRGRRARHAAVLGALLHPRPADLTAALLRALPDEVHLCRCEAVPAGRVRAAADAVGARADAGTGCGGSAHGGDVNAVKAATRAGMGLCQGRVCGGSLAALAGADRRLPFTARGPVRPVTLGAIAALAGGPVPKEAA